MELYKDQYIVVTGGAGFIGSGVIRALNDRGYSNIIVVDDFKTGEKWKNLVGKRYAEMISKHELFSWLKGKESAIEAFVHLGACSSTVENDASYLFENNYRFSMRLAEYAIDNGHRFVYASSAATYGSGSEGFSDNEDKLDELRPLNMYGYSKHMFDLWLKTQGVLDKVCGLKYFNVFGPNEYHKGRMSSAILHFVKQIESTGKIRLFKSSEPEKYSDGGQMRDFIYVKDAARITADLLKREVFGIYNLGTGEPNTWLDLGKAVFEGMQRPEEIEFAAMPDDLVGKYQNYTAADMDKLKNAFGEDLRFTPFNEAVIEYVSDYLILNKYW
jgi:ADP-L-glycero-D-manno-heptose 6-epimerase